MFKKIKIFFDGIILMIKKIIGKLLANINNICMFIAICGILYTPILLLEANNFFDIIKYSMIFCFYIINILIIGRK